MAGLGVCRRHSCRPARASYSIGGKAAFRGICLNWGCIPTKALLHGAEVAHSIAHADRLGFSLREVSFDVQKLVQFSRAVSQQLTGGVEYLLKKNGVTVITGTARLRGKGQVTVADPRGKSETIALVM